MHPDAVDTDNALLRRRLTDSSPYLPPAVVTVHPTNVCNHRCPWCWFERGPEKLSISNAIRTLESLVEHGAEEIIVSGGGEPLLHPEIARLVEFLGRRANTVRTKLYTHGGLIGRYLAEIIVAFDYVRISVDAGNGDVYSKLHGAPDGAYEELLSTAALLTSRGVTVGVSVVATADNASSLSALVDSCQSAGISHLLVKPVMQGLWRQSLPALPIVATGVGVEAVVRRPAEPVPAPTLPSSVATMAVTLTPQGAVVPCCHLDKGRWIIGQVGSVVDHGWKERHQAVAERYATTPHSCRAHDAWTFAMGSERE